MPAFLQVHHSLYTASGVNGLLLFSVEAAMLEPIIFRIKFQNPSYLQVKAHVNNHSNMSSEWDLRF